MKDFSLSVILPNYNHGHYLAGLLESMMAQSTHFDELIVVDDASTDDSVEIVKKVAAKYPKVRLVRNEKNAGVVATMAVGLEHAKGNYLIFPSADDKILPGLFEKSSELLKRYPEAGLCCSDTYTMSELTGEKVLNKRELSGSACYIPASRLVEIMRTKIVYLSGFGAVFKRSELLKTGFLPELKWSSDRIFTTIIAFRTGICYVPEPLAVYCKSKKSYSAEGVADRKKNQEVLEAVFELLKKPEYSDVLEKFRESCALASLHLAGLRVMAADGRFRDYLSPNLARLVLWDEFKNAVSGYVPEAAKKIWRGTFGRF